jgi:hypothetical protein
MSEKWSDKMWADEKEFVDTESLQIKSNEKFTILAKKML